jgi:nucleotide-binding universal stress UspA family protein
MIVLREILAATDLSTQSDKVMAAALALAQHFGARLHLLHVIPNASQEKMAQIQLDASSLVLGNEIKLVRTVSVGHAASEILKYAGREKIDLIVLGTHGRSGLAQVLMGSVAASVVRAAPCQVLTIGPEARAVPEATPLVHPEPAPERSHCLVCAKPDSQSICDTCKAHIQGEALERKRRVEREGHRGLSV